MVDFLNWMLTDGEKMANSLEYASLPDTVSAKVREAIKQIH